MPAENVTELDYQPLSHHEHRPEHEEKPEK